MIWIVGLVVYLIIGATTAGYLSERDSRLRDARLFVTWTWPVVLVDAALEYVAKFGVWLARRG